MKRTVLDAVISFSFLAMSLTSAGTAQAADAARGGRLWDKWWAVNGAAQPTGDHPLYATIGSADLASFAVASRR
jgi:hypothetical protein